MQPGKHNKTELMKKAVSSHNLTNRADSNRLYAKGDFNLWINSLLEKLKFSTVLDVCCGTGNQMVLYAARPEVKQICGVDISKEALAAAKERLDKMQVKARVVLKEMKMEDMFTDRELNGSKFDLISCFYGLYYSRDSKRTLNEMIDHLSGNGVLVIVGPYGANNAGLFALLRKHFTLPELVIRSSTTFMEEQVYPLLAERCIVGQDCFVNPICYPDPQSLIKYWKASTFYFPEFEEVVVRDIKEHFSKHKEFTVEKHVKAYIGRRKK